MPTSAPFQVDERAARVAGIDRCIGLDEVLVAFRIDARASERADDARRDRVTETEGVADRDDEIADLSLVGIGDRNLGEVRGLDLQHRDVGALVLADDFRVSERLSSSVTVISFAFDHVRVRMM